MKILIDTHIFLWILSCPEKLDDKRRYLIESQSNEIYLSAMSVTELMIKSSLDKLEINFNPVEVAQQIGIEILDFSGNDALLLKDMPYHHKDPFDRMIIAQAISKQMKLMSDDTKFKLYNCKLI